jgi:hypothetical protein
MSPHSLALRQFALQASNPAVNIVEVRIADERIGAATRYIRHTCENILPLRSGAGVPESAVFR